VDSGAGAGAIESGVTHITGHDRDQMLLLPESVDDYVAADNPVRFIDAFVDGLELAALGLVRVVPEATGRPGYAPGDLRVIYTSGGGQTDGATALSVEGAIFLPKPYRRQQLVEVLRSQGLTKN
jgi:hypothetical protein